MPVDLDLAERVVALLNELIELDADAIDRLSKTRVACNKWLGDHPTVQVHSEDGQDFVGLLGILNGLCGAYDSGPREGWGAVALDFYDDGGLIAARVLPNAELETEEA